LLKDHESLHDQVVGYIRRDFVSVRPQWTITECVASLRGEQETGGIYYVYVTDEAGVLKGVIPVRRMLAVDPSTRADEIMICKLVTLPESATVSEALELFMGYKLLAFPVVNERQELLGIVDVNVFTDEIIDTGRRKQADDVFQWIGVRMEVLKNASPLQAFRYRFPWLIATMASGVACAALAGFFEATLAEAAILAMFLTVALGLGESVSIQSMTMTMQALQGQDSLREFVKERIFKEMQTAALLAVSCGAIVGGVSIFWPGAVVMSASIGLSIAGTIFFAGLTGLAVPTVLHKLERDPRVAAGPITLAISDLTTVFLYLCCGTLALRLIG
jgi:magnesium transporter